jgi:hypothetical protein
MTIVVNEKEPCPHIDKHSDLHTSEITSDISNSWHMENEPIIQNQISRNKFDVNKEIRIK